SLRTGHPNPHPASSPRRGLRVRRAPSRSPRSPSFRRLLCLSSSGRFGVSFAFHQAVPRQNDRGQLRLSSATSFFFRATAYAPYFFRATTTNLADFVVQGSI
ncbi:unnamed protein product, partial [Musa acuminata subsp. burmannicoides]